MRGLTLIQPWAHAVAHLGKPVENRTWVPPKSLIGRYLAIHAGKKLDREALEDLALDGHVVERSSLVLGGIVAIARVDGWVRCEALLNREPEGFDGITEAYAKTLLQSLWWAGPIGWALSDVRPLAKPVMCPGAQGLWTVPAANEADVRAQLGLRAA